MKITLDIEHYEEYGCFTGYVGKTNKDDNNLDIKIDWSQLYINGTEAITEEQISNIGYFLTDSTPKGDDYPDRLIVSLGDDRKLGYGDDNYWALVFGDPSYYTFEEIFKMILTEQGTRGIDEKYAENFKKHLINIYDKTVEKEKTGVYREIEEKETEKLRNGLRKAQKRNFPWHYNKKEGK